MPSRKPQLTHLIPHGGVDLPQPEGQDNPQRRKPPQRVTSEELADPLLTVDDVARRLNVSRDWVWTTPHERVPNCR